MAKIGAALRADSQHPTSALPRHRPGIAREGIGTAVATTARSGGAMHGQGRGLRCDSGLRRQPVGVLIGLLVACASGDVAQERAGAGIEAIIPGGMASTNFWIPGSDGFSRVDAPIMVMRDPGPSDYFWAQQFWFRSE